MSYLQHRKPARWLTSARQLRAGRWPRIDFQMHTRWTDGRDTTAAMIAAARRQHLQAIAITEHLNFESTYWDDFVAEVNQLRGQAPGLSVYYGVEIAARDCAGNLKTKAAPREIAEWTLGVVHALPRPSGGFFRFEELSAAEALWARPVRGDRHPGPSGRHMLSQIRSVSGGAA